MPISSPDFPLSLSRAPPFSPPWPHCYSTTFFWLSPSTHLNFWSEIYVLGYVQPATNFYWWSFHIFIWDSSWCDHRWQNTQLVLSGAMPSNLWCLLIALQVQKNARNLSSSPACSGALLWMNPICRFRRVDASGENGGGTLLLSTIIKSWRHLDIVYSD